MRRVYGWLWLCLLAFLVGALISTIQNRIALPSLTLPDQLEVHFIDVGQGDSIFIRTPDGTTALIDGGPTSGNVLGYLKSQGVTRLDMVIISHPHQDHIGGLVTVLNTLTIGGVWTSGASSTTNTYERILDIIEARGIPYHEVQTSQVIPFSDLNFSVLYGVAKVKNLNNASLVLRLAYGQTSFLFTGDAEKAVEKTLLSTSAAILPATVLKIGHHGSYTSSSLAFVKAVSPQIAIYSAGRGNQYGHPHESTLETFAALDIPVYGTNELGSIVVISDGTMLRMTNK